MSMTSIELISDKNSENIGGLIEFTVTCYNNSGNDAITLYVNSINQQNQSFYYSYSVPNDSEWVVHHYQPFYEAGTFSVYAQSSDGQVQSETIVITITDSNNNQSVGQVECKIDNKTVSSLYLNNKEVKSIVTTDNIVIYNSEELLIELTTDKTALVYDDSLHTSDQCTLIATLSPMNDEKTIDIYQVSYPQDIYIGSMSYHNGYEYSYECDGYGEFELYAIVDGIESNHVYIDGCFEYQEGTYVTTTFSSPCSESCTCEYEINTSSEINMSTIELRDINGNTLYTEVLGPVNDWTKFNITLNNNNVSITSEGTLINHRHINSNSPINRIVITNSASGVEMRDIKVKPLTYIYSPLSKSNASYISWTSGTNQIVDGVYTSHGSILSEGWDNNGLWQLDFDCRASSSQNYYIGIMPICSSEINPYTDDKKDSYAIATWEGFTYPTGLGFTSWVSVDNHTKVKNTDWHHMTIIKKSETKLIIVLDNTYIAVGGFPNLANLTQLHIGSRDNPASRNIGDNILFKNITVSKI